jgi:hypothetical protein
MPALLWSGHSPRRRSDRRDARLVHTEFKGVPKKMKPLTFPLRAAAATLVLAAASLTVPTLQAQEPDWKFAGTVEINSTQMAFIISGKAGGGVLEYEGKEYAFDVAGLGVGGIGIQTLNAVGAVYNMDDVSKFPGTYVEGRMGAAVVKGKGAMRLSNQHGVILDLKASAKGAALSLGADGVIISMKK